MSARVDAILARAAWSLNDSFDAGVSAFLGHWPESANPFGDRWPDSAWAWNLGFRFAAYCDATQRRGTR